MDPLYYRFVIQPSNGKVTLRHHLEGHPADSNYHGQLAQEINEPGLVHGYAHRLKDGWRILDYESRPFTDPWVQRQVNKRLAQEEPLEPAQPPAVTWQESPAMQRFHYFHV